MLETEFSGKVVNILHEIKILKIQGFPQASYGLQSSYLTILPMSPPGWEDWTCREQSSLSYPCYISSSHSSFTKAILPFHFLRIILIVRDPKGKIYIWNLFSLPFHWTYLIKYVFVLFFKSYIYHSTLSQCRGQQGIEQDMQTPEIGEDLVCPSWSTRRENWGTKPSRTEKTLISDLAVVSCVYVKEPCLAVLNSLISAPLSSIWLLQDNDPQEKSNGLSVSLEGWLSWAIRSHVRANWKAWPSLNGCYVLDYSSEVHLACFPTRGSCSYHQHTGHVRIFNCIRTSSCHHHEHWTMRALDTLTYKHPAPPFLFY